MHSLQTYMLHIASGDQAEYNLLQAYILPISMWKVITYHGGVWFQYDILASHIV